MADEIETISVRHERAINNYKNYGLLTDVDAIGLAPMFRPKELGGENVSSPKTVLSHSTTSMVTRNGQAIHLITVLCCEDQVAS